MNLSVRRKIFLIGSGFLILIIGIWIGSQGGARYAAISSQSSVDRQSSNPLFSGDGKDVSVPTGDSFRVTRVIDGDTIELENGERVRYVGIDTPETVDPRKPVQCFGVEASKKNKELVEGKSVRLERDITDRDKYNRLLRYVWVGDTFINLALIEEGYAQSYSYPPDIKYQGQFVEAQRQARETNKGLWGGCASETASVVIPPITPSQDTTNDSCVIKGNISASGEKIYHLLGCGSYAKTQIDTGRGERWFCSEQEAQSAGWRRAFNCN